MANSKTYEMLVRIGSKLDARLPENFRRVTDQLKKAKAAMEKAKASWKSAGQAWKTFGNTIKVVGTAVGGATAAVGAALFKVTDDVAKFAFETGDAAGTLHMTAESLSTLRYAFVQTGESVEGADGLVSKMRINLGKMASNPKAAKVLEQYGLSAEKLFAMNPDEALFRIAEAYQHIESDADKAAVASALVGSKKSLDLMDFLSVGGEQLREYAKEAQLTGNVVTTEQAKQAEAYILAKNKMKASFEGIKLTFGSNFFEMFGKVFDQISKAVQDNLPAIKEFGATLSEKIQEALPKIIEIKDKIVEFGGKIWETVQKVKEFFGGWDKLAIVAGGILGLVMAVQGAIAIVTTFIAIVNTVKAAMAAWQVVQAAVSAATGLTLGPILLIIAVIIALIVVIVLLVKNWDTVKAVASKVADAIKAKWEEFKAAFSAVVTGVVQFFKDGLNSLVGFFSGIGQSIGEIAAAIGAFFSGAWQTASDTVRGIIQGIADFIRSVLETVQSSFSEKINAIAGLWSNITNGLSGIGEKIKGFFSGAFSWITDKIDGIRKAFEKAGNFLFGGGGGASTSSAPSSAPIPHAEGGIFNKPHLGLVAEAGTPESVIPINRSTRSRGLWAETGKRMGLLSMAPRRLAGALVNNANRAAVSRRPEVLDNGNANMSVNIAMPNVVINGNADGNTLANLQSMFEEWRGVILADVQRMQVQQKRNEKRLAY